MGQIQRVALGSIGVGLGVLGLKTLASLLTGSVALLSDALESIINVLTAAMAFAAIRVSAKPADRNHPYGHHKVEYFAVIVEGVCIVLAALAILREAVLALRHPAALDAPLQGLLINALGTGLNAAWGTLLARLGRRARSPALVAEGRHLFVDVATSLGVLAGVGLVVLTGLAWLDSAVAALVAVNVLWSGWSLVKESVAGLMDEAVPGDRLEEICAVVETTREGAIEVHDLKTRAAGQATFIEFHLVVSGRMSVADAHLICDRMERALREKVEGAVVTIHVEPENQAKRPGSMVLG